ncbi:PTS glucose transporter subunit IIA [Macrococcoides caseolyticum]|uniref:PTS sugar transporter subunit IIA n=1 Tax=Macrococcoides caseolyticum TaxID=69966 RepID=UPI0022B7E316|nr:PTS glucose transporter subunit IIA [Macrococcus caseolyticus]
MEDLLQSGADIPEPEETIVQPTVLDNSDGAGFIGHAHQLRAVADGEVIDITSVNDPVFSQKMMGEGYAVKPESEEVVSPVDGEIISIFPTKHAIGIRTNDGIEVLVHMGIETVQMKQPASRVVVNDGQKVKAGDTLAYMDLVAVRAEGKDTTIIIVMTNSDKVDTLQLNKTGIVQKGETVGTMTV